MIRTREWPPDVEAMTVAQASALHPQSRLGRLPADEIILLGRYRPSTADWPLYCRHRIGRLVGSTTFRWSAWTIAAATGVRESHPAISAPRAGAEGGKPEHP